MRRTSGKGDLVMWAIAGAGVFGLLAWLKAHPPGAPPERPAAAAAALLPSPDADGHPLHAGDVVMHINDHGAPTVAVGYRGRFIRVANPTLSILTGGIRSTDVTGVVYYESEVREGEHAGKVVTCFPRALRFVQGGR